MTRPAAFLLGAALATQAYTYPSLPDPTLTSCATFLEGCVRPQLTVEEICSTRWGRDARAITNEMKQNVLNVYRAVQHSWPASYEFEVDHLCSRELGCADVTQNLWAQCYFGPWGARAKDRLENELHRRVCAGQMTLDEARRAITSDWRKAYLVYFGPPTNPFPAPDPAACSADEGP